MGRKLNQAVAIALRSNHASLVYFLSVDQWLRDVYTLKGDLSYVGTRSRPKPKSVNADHSRQSKAVDQVWEGDSFLEEGGILRSFECRTL